MVDYQIIQIVDLIFVFCVSHLIFVSHLTFCSAIFYFCVSHLTFFIRCDYFFVSHFVFSHLIIFVLAILCSTI
jgi:hypothetical protein